VSGLVATSSTWNAVRVSAPALVLAHQGGWDELLFVLVPIALFAGLLAIANRRAVRAQAELEQRDEPDPD
jgi:hypothetical protein